MNKWRIKSERSEMRLWRCRSVLRLHDSPVTTERERKRREMKQIATIHLSWQHFICHIVEPSSAAFPPGTCVLLHTLTVCIQEFSFFIFFFFKKWNHTHTNTQQRRRRRRRRRDILQVPFFSFWQSEDALDGESFCLSKRREDPTTIESNTSSSRCVARLP